MPQLLSCQHPNTESHAVQHVGYFGGITVTICSTCRQILQIMAEGDDITNLYDLTQPNLIKKKVYA